MSLFFQFLLWLGTIPITKEALSPKRILFLLTCNLTFAGLFFASKTNKQTLTINQPKKKTLTILNPLAHIDQHIMDERDLAGPIVFVLFGTSLLLSGKVHFGYIYSLALIGSLSLHTSFSLMSPPPLNHTSSHIDHQMHQQQSSSLASSLTYP